MNTEPHIIKSDGYIGAWLNAAKLLVNEGDRFNLTIHVNDPTRTDERAADAFCHRRVSPAIHQSVYDVANTIFPAHSKFHEGTVDDFFHHYEKIYLRGQRRHPTAWGTYFLRLIRFGGAKENQLRKILNGLTTWKSRPRAAFVMHLSSAETDSPRSLGAPCWQYAQFIRNEDNVLSMSAVYRSHDYFQKALGNFMGLSRLLKFVCVHSGMTPGTLTCLSTYASLQGQQSKTRKLLGI